MKQEPGKPGSFVSLQNIKAGESQTATQAVTHYPFSSALNLRESLKTTTLRAGRVIASLVWGLRPLRAFLS